MSHKHDKCVLGKWDAMQCVAMLWCGGRCLPKTCIVSCYNLARVLLGVVLILGLISLVSKIVFYFLVVCFPILWSKKFRLVNPVTFADIGLLL